MHAIVDGEPGIFPAPVAQILRKVAGLFRRKKKDEEQEKEADRDG